MRGACAVFVCMNTVSCMGSTFQLLLMPFCCLLALLLDEPLSELLLLSLPSALTVHVLTGQAGEHHLCITLLSFSTEVGAVQVMFPLAPRLLVLMPVVDDGPLHRMLLLHLSSMEKPSYFAIMEHISICMENTSHTDHNAFH